MKFEVPSFIDSKDMIGSLKFKIWVTWPWPRPSGYYHPKANTSTNLPVYKIWCSCFSRYGDMLVGINI